MSGYIYMARALKCALLVVEPYPYMAILGEVSPYHHRSIYGHVRTLATSKPMSCYGHIKHFSATPPSCKVTLKQQYSWLKNMYGEKTVSP